MGIGDWGFGDWGLGDWAQSPIPNPQSPIPIPNPQMINNFYIENKNYLNFIFKNN